MMVRQASYRARAERALGRPLKTRELVHHHSATQLVICTPRYHQWLHREMKRRGIPTPQIASRSKPSKARPYVVGETLPAAMGPGELRRALNLAIPTFYAYQKAGKLKRFEFRRPVSIQKRYSGALVTRYLENESDQS